MSSTSKHTGFSNGQFTYLRTVLFFAYINFIAGLFIFSISQAQIIMIFTFFPKTWSLVLDGDRDKTLKHCNM